MSYILSIYIIVLYVYTMYIHIYYIDIIDIYDKLYDELYLENLYKFALT